MNTRQLLAEINRNTSVLVLEQKERKEQQAYQNKVIGAQTAMQALGQLATQFENPTLQMGAELGSTITSMIDAYNILQSPGCVGLAAAGPVGIFIMGATTVISIFSRKKRKNKESDSVGIALMQNMRIISEQIYNMHKDMLDGFSQLQENDRIIFQTVCEGFKSLDKRLLHLERALSDQILDLGIPTLVTLNQVEASLNQFGTTLARGQEVISLQPFGDVINRAIARIEETETEDQKKAIQEIARYLTDWIKLNGRASIPMHTGAKWIPLGNDALNVYQWINNTALHNVAPETLNDTLGFLANLANKINPKFDSELMEMTFKLSSAHLGEDYAEEHKDEFGVNAVANSHILSLGVDVYTQLRNKFGEHIPDKKNISLNRIISSVINEIAFIKLLQQSPIIFKELFAQYLKVFAGISSMVNKALHQQSTTTTLKYFDLTKSLDEIVSESKREDYTSFFNTNIVGRTEVYRESVYTPTYYPNQNVINPCVPGTTTIEIRYRKAQDLLYKHTINHPGVFDKEFTLVYMLGLGSFQMAYDIQFRDLSPVNFSKQFYINIAFDNRNYNQIFVIHQAIEGVFTAESQTVVKTPIQHEGNLKTARIILSDFIVNHRKKAYLSLQKGENYPELNNAMQQLDAIKKLIKAFALLIGVNAREISLVNDLYDSKQLKDYLLNPPISPAEKQEVPLSDLFKSILTTQSSLLSTVQEAKESYFESPIEMQMNDALGKLNAVKAIEFKAKVAKEVQQVALKSELSAGSIFQSANNQAQAGKTCNVTFVYGF